MKKLILLVCTLSWGVFTFAQENTEGGKPDYSYKPLTLQLSDDGGKYIRFIVWHKQWFQTNNLAIEDSKFQVNSFVRRSRFLAYAQISPRFLILTHFGLNNLTANNLTSLGNNGDGTQLFLHNAWTEFKVSNNDALYIGGGLHYWKGLTCLANQSTLNYHLSGHNAKITLEYHSVMNNPSEGGVDTDGNSNGVQQLRAQFYIFL